MAAARGKESGLGSVLRIEPARLTDASNLAEMSRRLIERGLGWRWTPDAIARQIRSPGAIVLVARARDASSDLGDAGGPDDASGPGEETIGFAAMRFDFDRSSAHLLLLGVEPTHRHQGVGRALVTWLEQVARRGGIRKLVLEVRETATSARAFYALLGFRKVDRVRGYYQQREDALTLRKDLTKRA